MIVDHDLHSHDGELTDGIAEAFIAWAENEGLSFWRIDEERLDDKRRKGWQYIIDNNRSRRFHVDPDIDISRLADEMNDVDLELEG